MPIQHSVTSFSLIDPGKLDQGTWNGPSSTPAHDNSKAGPITCCSNKGGCQCSSSYNNMIRCTSNSWTGAGPGPARTVPPAPEVPHNRSVAPLADLHMPAGNTCSTMSLPFTQPGAPSMAHHIVTLTRTINLNAVNLPWTRCPGRCPALPNVRTPGNLG